MDTDTLGSALRALGEILLERLEPTPEELRLAAAWTITHDPTEPFRDQLRQALEAFGVRDGEL